jgi:hypothetical protein
MGQQPKEENKEVTRALKVLYLRVHAVICPERLPPKDVPPEFAALFDGVNMTTVLRSLIRSEPAGKKDSELAITYGCPVTSITYIRRTAGPLPDTEHSDK